MGHLVRWTMAGFALWAGILLHSGSPRAETIRVAADGTGDFTVLFDAVTAAASGDTISIGPGNYTDIRPSTVSGSTFDSVAHITQQVLTIRGDDATSVLIGPLVPAPDLETGPYGIVVSSGQSVSLENITVRNVSSGVEFIGQSITVRDARFSACHQGVVSFAPDETTILNSQFDGCEDRGILVFKTGNDQNVLIDSCFFESNIVGADLQSLGSIVNNCEFEGGRIGFQSTLGGYTTVSNCRFSDQLISLASSSGGFLNLVDNRVSGGGLVGLQAFAGLSGAGNIFEGEYSVATIQISRSAAIGLNFQGNHITNSHPIGTTVKANSPGGSELHADFRNNYWGTADAVAIAASILDGNDDDITTLFIDFEPFLTDPVPTRKQSMSSFRSMFGGQ